MVHVGPAVAAEAAVWVARLHGPSRTARMEQECLQWQARSAEHRWAFERCTETWQEVGGLTLAALAGAFPDGADLSARETARGMKRRMNRRMWAVAATGGVALLCGGFLLTDPERYETGVGERRTVVLKDGSRISLNTASRIHVRWTPSRRIVELETGEALFEVAKDPRRPFVAVADGVEVRAIGTSFVVRSDAGAAGRDEASGDTSVTLIEGKVVVTKVSGKNERVSPVSPMSPMSSVMAVEMLPGERLRIALAPGLKSAEVAKDRPRIDQVTAWQRGEAVFDRATLREAVAEMNRYSPMRLALAEEGGLAQLRISGVYRTGDNASFARAVAELTGLRIVEHPDRIELLGRMTLTRPPPPLNR